jgi:hypothetical protein
MRPIGEDLADSIGQHRSGPHFDKDARPSFVQRLHLRQELHRAYQVFDQQMGHRF